MSESQSSVEEQLAQANRQLAELQRQVAWLMQAGNPVTTGEAEAAASWEQGSFKSDVGDSSNLRSVDTQPLDYGGPRLLKRPPDGCTPDVWDSYGRLLQYEPLPE